MKSRIGQRNSNIEILRIAAMLLIVMNHYSSQGLGWDLAYAVNKYVALVARTGGKFGMIVFVLISGYYMCDSKITGRKIALIWGQISFYAVSIAAAFYLLQFTGFGDVLERFEIVISIKTILLGFLPIGQGTYGFAAEYVLLMMISPLLNLLLHKLGKKELLVYLVIALTLWSVLPVFTNMQYEWNQIGWFAVVYLFAGYIRLYAERDTNWRRNIKMGIFIYAFIVFLIMIAVYVGHISGNISYVEYAYRFRGVNSPLVLFSGMEFLLGFVKLKPFVSTKINVIGSATFGVYLIHENPFVVSILWKYVLHLPDSVYDSTFLVLHMIVSVVAIFALCVVVDLIRQMTVERIYIHLIDKMQTRAHILYSNYIDRISNIFECLLH